MVFEKKQLSKALAIALMVACAVAFMPLLNGQAFAAAKKPAKVKSLKAAQVADTMTAKATWKKGKNCKKYNVKVDGVLVAKKQKAKSYTTEALTEGAHKIAVAGVNGKKVGKYKTVTVNIVAPTPPVTKLEVAGVVQSGVKQLKVTFTQDIADPSAFKFVVTRAGKEITFTAKADPNDPKSVLLDLDSTIVEGSDYAVKVYAGDGLEVPAASGATTDVKGETGKVASIDIGDTLVLNDGRTTGTVKYAVKNQFGEDITATEGQDANLSITQSFSAATATANPKTNKVTIGTTANPIYPTLQVTGSTGTVVVVYKKTGVSAQKTVTVGDPAKISEINVLGLYDKKALSKDTLKETTIVANAYKASNEAVALFTVKDQYGDEYGGDVNANTLTANLVAGLTNLNPNVTWDAVTVGDDTYYAIPMKDKNNKYDVKAGNASIILVANATGAKAQYDFTVGDQDTIASLTVAAPAQVIGNDDNEFTLTATNAAGEAITSYALLNNKITWTNPTTGTFKLREQVDGTAKLIFEAKKVNGNALGYVLDTASFSAVDNVAATSFLSFSVLPGKGVPTGIKDFKLKTVDTDVNGTTTGTQLTKITYTDVFGNELKEASDIDTTSIVYSTTDPNLTAAKYRLAVELNGKKVELTNKAGVAVTHDGNTWTSARFALASDLTDDEWIVSEDGLDAGESATGKVTMSLYQGANATTYPSPIDDLTKTATVTNDVAEQDYDGYAMNVAVDGIVDDVEEIYVPQLKADGSDWKVEPTQYTYDISAYGILNNNEYPLTDYVITDTAGMVVWAGDHYELALEENGDPAEAIVDGATETTLNLAIPGEASVITKKITFNSTAPVATSIDDPKEYNWDNYPIFFDNNAFDAADVRDHLAVRDQYGVPFYSGKASVTVDSVLKSDKKTVIPAVVDADADPETWNYKVPYTGTSFRMERNGNPVGVDEYGVPEGSYINLNVKYGTIDTTVLMKVYDYKAVGVALNDPSGNPSTGSATVAPSEPGIDYQWIRVKGDVVTPAGTNNTVTLSDNDSQYYLIATPKDPLAVIAPDCLETIEVGGDEYTVVEGHYEYVSQFMWGSWQLVVD